MFLPDERIRTRSVLALLSDLLLVRLGFRAAPAGCTSALSELPTTSLSLDRLGDVLVTDTPVSTGTATADLLRSSAGPEPMGDRPGAIEGR
jgi:hypothetical protein